MAAKGDVGAETSFPPTFCLNEGFHPGSPPLGCQHRELVANIGLSKVFQPQLDFRVLLLYLISDKRHFIALRNCYALFAIAFLKVTFE